MSKKCVKGLAVNLSAVLIIIFLGLFLPALSQDDPSISLVKTIEVREYEGLRFNIDEYQVQSGDSLAKILRRRKVIGLGPLPAKAINLVMALNKDLVNPDLIVPGQKLILPTGRIEGLSPSIEEVEEAARQAALEPEKKPDPVVAGDGDKVSTTSGVKHKTIRVEHGDSLSKLLRRQGLPDKLIFNEYIQLTLKLNPHITDPNIIYAGTEIELPFKGTWAETAVAGRGKKKRKPPKAPPTVTRTKPKRTAKVEQKPKRTIIPPPQLPPSRHLAARTALGLIFTRMGERYISKGQHFLPLRTGGQITINTQSFPIIELQSGQRIILDLDNRLPGEMVDIIRDNWSTYTIFRTEKGENLQNMIGRLFSTSRYYKILGKGSPWEIKRDVHVKIAADWIVWPTLNDWNAGRAVVITFPASHSLGTSPELAEFLAARGIKVIDFHPRGNIIGPEPSRSNKTGTIEMEDMTSNNIDEFVQMLLTLVGQKYETNLSIPLMQSKSPGQEFNFTVEAPIYFTRHGKNFVVAPRGLSADVNRMLTEHNFEVIIHKMGETPQLTAQKLLNAMNVKAETGLTIKASRRAAGQNIEVTMPGLLFRSSGKEILLTNTRAPQSLAQLLTRPNLKVVHYRVINPS